MAIENPRISFSHDLHQSDVVQVEQYVRTSSPSSIDFNFCVFSESFDQDQSSSADELFFDGKILPIEIKRRLAPPRKVDDPPPPAPAYLRPLPPPPKPNKTNTNFIGEAKNQTNSESEEKHKSFWRFKRSTSLNCGSGYGRSFCPLPLLSRSNSTGSSAAGKRQPVSNTQKQSFLRGNSSSSSQKQTQTGNYSSRPPLKKNHHGSSSNGFKFNPVLHVPPANFFGLVSFFSGSRASSKKKY
ncbi:hypothetical protein CASFOL_015395 [Castilleja foliolosa]|uniref:Uncharacterized protein n=1 Tax=Castilleja foliolosa TaxID=1961234 RepID=A0ABD3DHJ3_9LAMI